MIIKRILIWLVITLIALEVVFQFHPVYGTGPSMEPTLPYHSVSLVAHIPYHVGDIISINCYSKCQANEQNDILLKRLSAIDSHGCLYLRGDNPLNSNDSRYFGWLCPSDYQVYGVDIHIFK